MQPNPSTNTEGARPMDEAILRITRLPPAQFNLTQRLQFICRVSAETLDVERVGIWILSQDTSAIRCICLHERSKNLFSEGATLHVAEFPAYFAHLESLRTIPADRAHSDPRTCELNDSYLVPLGITSMLDAGIYVNGEFRGVICHEHIGLPREWTTEERDFAGSVADQVALKIKSAEIAQLTELLHERDADKAALREHEGIARMAAGVAHDFRNYLTVVMGAATEITDLVPSSSRAGLLAAQIVDTARRAGALTSDLMTIGNRNNHRPQIVDPAQVLDRFINLLQKAVGPSHCIVRRSFTCSCRVLIDPSQLERLILNLVLNARDAMVAGGDIELAVTSESEISGCAAARVVISVTDTGGGVPGELVDRIFEPYFTTKAAGYGTGLGLTMARQLVQHAGGELVFENNPGTGATFRICLPCVARA